MLTKKKCAELFKEPQHRTREPGLLQEKSTYLSTQIASPLLGFAIGSGSSVSEANVVGGAAE